MREKSVFTLISPVIQSSLLGAVLQERCDLTGALLLPRLDAARK